MKYVKLAFVLLCIFGALRIAPLNASASSERHPYTHPLLGTTPVHTFVVTSKNDTGDDTRPGSGTLRWAIVQANASAGFDLIRFNIAGSGVQTIHVKNGLTVLTDNAGVWIDGTQSDDRIEIDGTQTSNHHGIPIASNNNIIKGLVINNIPDGGTGIGIYNGGSYNVIIGNYLGTNPGGNASKSANSGVYIGPNSHDNLVGGTNGVTPGGACTGDCNLLSGNRAHGIVIDHAYNNRVIGNFIGLNAAGTSAVPNGDDGVLLGNANNNIIGGATPQERNVISGNYRINVEMGESGAHDNLVRGNFIGTNSAGTASLGGKSNGVVIDNNAAGNIIDSNVIAGNGGTGILIFLGATRTTVKYNALGYAADGSNLANSGIGILVQGNKNTFTGNRIGNHPTDGIRIKWGTGNAIRMNELWNNAKLGINLNVDGFTANDPGDGDSGANNLQNFPVISNAGISNGTLTVQGTLNSRPNARFSIDLFQSPSCDNTYNRNVGEGKDYLGSVDVSTNSSGNASFSASYQTSSGSGVVTGTATDSGGNTSEFSECRTIQVTAPPPTTPELLAPDNGGTPPSNPPTLSWNASQNAVRYVVIVKQDAKNGTTVHKNKTVSSTQYTLPSALANGHTYYWRVKACNSSNVCVASTWFSFTVP